MAQTATPTQASIERNARRAVGDERAIAYLGHTNSGYTVRSMPITNRGGLLQICPSCSYVGLARKEGALPGHPERLYPTGKRHFLHIAPNDHLQAAAQVEYLQREDVDRIAILHGQEYGSGLARLVAQVARRAGITLTTVPHVPRGDIRKEARSAAGRRGADGLWQRRHRRRESDERRGEGRSRPARLRRRRPGERWICQLAEGRGRPISDYGAATARSEQCSGSEIRRAIREVYGSAPFPNTYLAYKAMRRVIQAARAASERADERSAVISAIFAAPEENTIVGRYRFDKNGDTTLTRFGGYRATGGKLTYDVLLGKRPS